jgi:ATP-dependent Clp protease adaptor protein ClpS
VAIEILGLLVAGAGASWGWWQLQRRRWAKVSKRELERILDGDSQIVFSVASHAVTSRGQPEMWPLHLLYGLLQDESFKTALTALGGDPDAVETKVLARLDELKTLDGGHAQLIETLNRAFTTAHISHRQISIADLGSRVAYTDAGSLIGVEPYELCFRLVHGLPLPPTELPGRTDVAVVLRNDNHTTFEFVMAILQNLFDVSSDRAKALAMETHEKGRAIIGRYKLAVAKDKLIAARSRARDQGFPLWIGLEDC